VTSRTDDLVRDHKDSTIAGLLGVIIILLFLILAVTFVGVVVAI
jgi:preprotein translocase subunit SecD